MTTPFQFNLATSLFARPTLSKICSRCIHQTYYDVLKIQPNSSSKEVRDAFINLSKQNHPDKRLNDPSMHDRFVKINEAYSVLINPSSRKEYDRTLVQKKFSETESVNNRGAYHYQSYEYKRPESNPKRTSYHSRSQARDNKQQEFHSYYWQAHSDTKGTTSSSGSYYGIRGMKKISNTVIVSCLVALSAITFIVQMMTIGSHAKKNKDRALDESRKNSLLLAMAREKAKLYGNEHQINLLKKTLDETYEPILPLSSSSSPSDTSSKGSEPSQSNASHSAPASNEPVGKPCKKCKKTVKPVMAA